MPNMKFFSLFYPNSVFNFEINNILDMEINLKYLFGNKYTMI